MRFFVVALIAVASIVFSLIRVVDRRQTQVTISYEIAEATQRQRNLEEQLERLRIDRAALLHPSRVEKVGLDWGLRPPAPEAIVVVDARLVPAEEGQR